LCASLPAGKPNQGVPVEVQRDFANYKQQLEASK
jgi:hypothetical protein